MIYNDSFEDEEGGGGGGCTQVETLDNHHPHPRYQDGCFDFNVEEQEVTLQPYVQTKIKAEDEYYHLVPRTGEYRHLNQSQISQL
jgi:hypothetical protein